MDFEIQLKDDTYYCINRKYKTFVSFSKMTQIESILIKVIDVEESFRGKGYGTDALKSIIKIINEKFPGLPICLFCYYPYDPSSYSKLKKWYMKNGFYPVTEDKESATMIYTNGDPEVENQIEKEKRIK